MPRWPWQLQESLSPLLGGSLNPPDTPNESEGGGWGERASVGLTCRVWGDLGGLTQGLTITQEPLLPPVLCRRRNPHVL